MEGTIKTLSPRSHYVMRITLLFIILTILTARKLGKRQLIWRPTSAAWIRNGKAARAGGSTGRVEAANSNGFWHVREDALLRTRLEDAVQVRFLFSAMHELQARLDNMQM